MRSNDSGEGPEHENGEREKQMQGTDAPITEEALTAALSDADAGDEKPLTESAAEPGGSLDEGQLESPLQGGSVAETQGPLREAEEEKGSESGQPTPGSQDLEAVFETVHQLQTLDSLLQKLNFRELIIQFGQLQADLEVLYDGVQHIRNMVRDGEELLLAMIGNGEASRESSGIPLSALNARLELLHRVIRLVVNRIRMEQQVQGEKRDRWMVQVKKAMAAMSQLHEAHRVRMEMVQALNDQVDSPSVTNQQLASSALEFAVYMKELETMPAATAFEEAFAELEVLQETLDQFQEESSTADLELPPPEALEDTMRFLGDLPDLIGEMSALLNNLSSELAGLSEGVRAARPADESASS